MTVDKEDLRHMEKRICAHVSAQFKTVEVMHKELSKDVAEHHQTLYGRSGLKGRVGRIETIGKISATAAGLMAGIGGFLLTYYDKVSAWLKAS